MPLPRAPLLVTELTYAQLSADSAAAFFKNAAILDVVGDTIVLIEKNPALSRLIVYNLTDGGYLGEINHRGQGPGEYRMILGAFVNDADGSVLLPNFDNQDVNKYSLAADTLIATIERQAVMSMIEPIGGVGTAINVAAPSPEGLTIYQYDGNYNLTDTLSLDGFEGGNFNMLWANAGTNGVFMVADTLYTLLPGELHPTAILSRGDFALTADRDRELTMKAMEGASELELLKPFILVRDVQLTDGKMLLTTMHDGAKHSDLYDLAGGKLLYRSSYDQLSLPSCIAVEDADGNALVVQSLFAKNGKWYGLVDVDNTDNTSVDTTEQNFAVVSFAL